ncbi:TPR domain protein [Acaryochloris marina MBIC11017]|uniref:TPR domain protein n=2 Tax=Acaryochloris marina TaxID=155978 RepID=B0C2L6_ACAM1|nr:TPR domain protein [Acaryochloris marina MBIC11017]
MVSYPLLSMKKQYQRELLSYLSWHRLCLSLLGVGCMFAITVVFSEERVLAEPTEQVWVANTNNLEQRGKALFDARQFPQAADVLRAAVGQYQQRDNRVGEAIALSNLALVYEQLGQWPEANQAIEQSLELLQGQSTPEAGQLLAQVLNTEGQLKLAQGQAQLALKAWQRSEEIFTQIGDTEAVTRSRVNQAQALQSMGQYRRSIKTLRKVTTDLAEQPDSLTEVVALRSLGEALRVAGELPDAREALEKSVEMAGRLDLLKNKAAAQLSLGNVLRAEGENDPMQLQAALRIYEQLATESDESQVQAFLNQFSLLVQMKQFAQAEGLWPQVSASLQQLPLSRSSIFAYLNVVHSLSQLRSTSMDTVAIRAQLFRQALKQAKTLGDGRAESYVLGGLGALYEETGQWAEAERLTQQALKKAINDPEIAFRWQWQLGRLQKVQGNRDKAISAYSGAVQTLKLLRKDLIAVNPEVQFSFRDNVEPIHRQLVDLLLEVEEGQPSSKNLEAARLTIESLQLAELDNFFREACLDANPVVIDEIDPRAAVVYPIILPKRVAVIVSLPGKKLRLYSTEVSSNKVERTVDRLRLSLGQPNSTRYLALSQQVYNWLLRPAEADFIDSKTETLVFVLDGVLRNVPMSALHDGESYLVERYAVSVTPGLQLVEPKPLVLDQVKVLTAGLSQPVQGFSGLPYVESELNQIGTIVSSRNLLNQAFTRSAFQREVSTEPYSVVHLATHGQFSSKLEDTFLLTWEDKVNITQLRDLLRTRELRKDSAIELLVLSACETAVGDSRAALGLAGMAARSGARTTLATLWQVDDQATSILMARFYELLNINDMSKARALQVAQKEMLIKLNRQHPSYWSSYILLGNWK